MTDPGRPAEPRGVDYKGAPLDPARGPGLGCFWIQVVVLVVLLVLTPLSVDWGWPFWASATLLVLLLILLLFAGQTVIFLLRLVAAERRAIGRRRPLASATPTVGELEDGAAEPAPAEHAPGEPARAEAAPADGPASDAGDEARSSSSGGVRE